MGDSKITLQLRDPQGVIRQELDVTLRDALGVPVCLTRPTVQHGARQY